MTELIYCADGNPQFADIAIASKFIYGSQATKKFYRPIEFSDLDPENIPQLSDYSAALKEHRPQRATVMDWERPNQLSLVLGWAEEIAPHVGIIIIIPKVIGGIRYIPKMIGGKPVHLGYSVPTSHGGTPVPVWEFENRPVHLLGGSPQRQKYLSHYLNVVSTDGNMAHLMATGQNRAGVVSVWQSSKRKYKRGHWVALQEYLGYTLEIDAPYVAFEISCKNIMDYWK